MWKSKEGLPCVTSANRGIGAAIATAQTADGAKRVYAGMRHPPAALAERMTTNAEALVRRAYQLAEGNVMDVPGFMDLFADDGVITAGQQNYRGEHLADLVVWLGKMAPDVHRELHRVHANGNLISVELSIQGTFTGPFKTPAGVIQITGVKLDTPGADVWYVEDGKIKEFNCNVDRGSMFAQLSAHPDFASAVEAQAAER